MFLHIGIATQAVSLFINHIFENYPEVHRIQALIYCWNEGSHRVLSKAGFLKEGTLRHYFTKGGELQDGIVYSFIRSDWRRKEGSIEV